jgi:hypothetical protein
MSEGKLIPQLETLLAGVEATLTALVGDSSLCQIGREGQPANAVKYHEGKYNALRTVRRLLDSPDFEAGLQAALAKAEKSLNVYRHGRLQHPDWISYYQGEVDGYRAVSEL